MHIIWPHVTCYDLIWHHFFDCLFFFIFFDFLDPAPVFEVSDMALLIPEVWDFYRLSGASFFFIIILPFFIDFSLLSSPGYSLSSPGGPPDRKKKSFFFPQHLVEGLLNSRRRVSDRPGWILIFKTPARKSTNVIVVVVFFFIPASKMWVLCLYASQKVFIISRKCEF